LDNLFCWDSKKGEIGSRSNFAFTASRLRALLAAKLKHHAARVSNVVLVIAEALRGSAQAGAVDPPPPQYSHDVFGSSYGPFPLWSAGCRSFSDLYPGGDQGNDHNSAATRGGNPTSAGEEAQPPVKPRIREVADPWPCNRLVRAVRARGSPQKAAILFPALTTRSDYPYCRPPGPHVSPGLDLFDRYQGDAE
jgi:hypothetical protein